MGATSSTDDNPFTVTKPSLQYRPPPGSRNVIHTCFPTNIWPDHHSHVGGHSYPPESSIRYYCDDGEACRPSQVIPFGTQAINTIVDNARTRRDLTNCLQQFERTAVRAVHPERVLRTSVGRSNMPTANPTARAD